MPKEHAMPKTGFFAWSVMLGLVVASLALHFIPPQSATTPTYSGLKQSVGPFSYADAVDLASPAVVNIYTSTKVKAQVHPLMNDPFFRRFFDRAPMPRSRMQSSLGSGVIVSSQGLVLTNNHVIDGADEILVALKDGRTGNAKIIGRDKDTDLALLKIPYDDVPVMPFVQNDDLRVGDVVLAIGNPFGVGQTVTMGIVSGTGRNQLGIATYEDFIQTDAAVNRGNSGGALVNAGGELVGINTAIYSESGTNLGIGFAIPLKHALDVVDDLLKYGQVIRGWLGLETQELTDQLKTTFGLPDNLVGQVVVRAAPGGPAAMAGLQAGDIVTHYNGQPADKGTQTMRQIADLRPGQKVTMGVIRNGQSFKVTAIVGRRLTK